MLDEIERAAPTEALGLMTQVTNAFVGDSAGWLDKLSDVELEHLIERCESEPALESLITQYRATGDLADLIEQCEGSVDKLFETLQKL